MCVQYHLSLGEMITPLFTQTLVSRNERKVYKNAYKLNGHLSFRRSKVRGELHAPSAGRFNHLRRLRKRC